MNQAQRKFLIDKIEKRFDLEIKLIKDSIPDRPNLESHITHEIMSGRVDIVDNDTIKKLLIEKVLSFKGSDRLFGSSRSWDFKNTIEFKADDFFITPDSYNQKLKNWKVETSEANQKLSQLEGQKEMLVLRIQIASPKKLEKLISEVDDFGDLSLFDTKLKMLND